MPTTKKYFRFLLIAFLWCLFIPEITFAQSVKELRISFRPVYGAAPLIPVKKYDAGKNGGSIRVNTLRFYISNVKLQRENATVWQEKNSVHLIDFTNASTFNIHLSDVPDVKYDELVFNLGIDSITNVSGAMGGDLDPTNGMYWTWQSGYVNMKLMGTYSDESIRNKEFQFHIGGYQFPYYAMQTVSLTVAPMKDIAIDADFSELLRELNYIEVKEIMQPCDEAMKFAEKSALIFRSRVK
jgi:hypothetical protein